jgi:hypothetical protein
MTRTKQPRWPSDDDVREPSDEAFTDDGRKRQDSERVGGMAPDVEPEQQPPRRTRRRQ